MAIGNIITKTVTTTTAQYVVTSIAALPSVAEGLKAFVNDSNVAASGNFGAIVNSGGANVVPVFCDGVHWRIG